MTRLTIDLTMSLDGYVAGPDPSQQDPLGVGGERLHEWAFAASSWREQHGHGGGEGGADSDVIQEHLDAIGASIMGRVAGGAEAVQQCLPHADTVQLHVAPVLLGGGRRLLDNLGDPPLRLEPDRVVASPAVTHLRYRVAS